MRIVLNDAPRECVPGTTCSQLLAEEIGAASYGYALAINDQVVPRSQWPQQRITEGDRVMIVRAVQGG